MPEPKWMPEIEIWGRAPVQVPANPPIGASKPYPLAPTEMFHGMAGPAELVGTQEQKLTGSEKPDTKVDWFDSMSAAFKSFGKAVNTPGFLGMMLGNIGSAIANEGTWQQRLGQAGAKIGEQQAYANYLNKLMRGETPSDVETSILSPELVNKAQQQVAAKRREGLEERGVAAEEKRTEATSKLAEAQAAGIAPYQEEQMFEAALQQAKIDAQLSDAQLNILRDALKPPTLQTIPMGPEGREAAVYMTPVMTENGVEYKTNVVSTGTPQTPGKMTEAQMAKEEQDWFDRAVKLAKDATGKSVVDPATGLPSFTLTDPAKGLTNFQSVLTQQLENFAKLGKISPAMVEAGRNFIPPDLRMENIQAGQAAASEYGEWMPRK